MAKFSLAPGSSLDIIGVPNLDMIMDFIDGDLGISDSIRDSFIQKTVGNMEGESIDTFNNLVDNNSNNGINSLERTVIQSVFETQKPYMEIARSVMDGVVVIEDIIAASLAGVSRRSLKPTSNPDSLYSKLNASKDILNEVNKLSNTSYNSFKGVSQEQRESGIPVDELSNLYKNKPEKISDIYLSDEIDIEGDFITVSIYYSTGTYIEGIPYKYSYRYIVDNPSVSQNTGSESIEIPSNYIEGTKPVVIFDIWVDEKGDGKNIRKLTENDILNLPWDINDKWLGEWGSWSKNPNVFENEYTDYLTNRLEKELDEGGVSDLNLRKSVMDMAIDSIPFNDTINNIKFQSELYNSSIYNISTDDYIGDRWRTYDRFGIKPKKVGDLWYDPETDYELQLIKIIPSHKEPKHNPNITNNPLSNRYGSEKIEDVLLPSDYDGTKFKNISYSGDNVTNRIRRDGTYINSNGDRIEDKRIYYVVEGIHKDRQESSESNDESESSSRKYYKFGVSGVRLGRSIAYVVSRFIKFVSTYIVKIISLISEVIELFSNPFNFLFEVLLEKVGDSFDVFSMDTVGKINKLNTISNIEDKIEYVENDPQLSGIVSFDKEGNYRLITDGSGFVEFMGMGFGIGVDKLSPKMTVGTDLDVDSLISSADSYIDKLDDLGNSDRDKAESISLKMKSMEKLQMAQKIDPNNTDIKERMDRLQTGDGVRINILFQSIIELVALPIKLILKVIEYILDFFNSLRPTNLPTKIKDFLTFKWITDIIKPSIIFDLLGIEINPAKLVTWSSELSLTSKLSKYDMSEILEFPLMGRLDIYDSDTLPSILKGGNKTMLLSQGVFKFIQEIINSIICFLFNVFNIQSLINCPEINLTKLVSGSLSPSDISSILEQDDNQLLSLGDDSMNSSGALYIYDIILSDGSVVTDLSFEEMELFKLNNPGYDYSDELES